MDKRILITGVTGQDGSNLVDYLLNNTNHQIIGTVRLLSNKNHYVYYQMKRYIPNSMAYGIYHPIKVI